MKRLFKTFLIIIILSLNRLNAQEIREYTVRKIASDLIIDGKLSEPEWTAAAFTEKFINYLNGSSVKLSTRAKFLWNDEYLFIGIICEDPDVRATITTHDHSLWQEDVIEIFCDPDGDEKNYLEVQINPLETILDLFLNKSYFAGGKPNFDWNIDSIKRSVWIDGTINDQKNIDSKWICEVALPFKELIFLAPSAHFPPENNDIWRILLTRYDYKHTEKEKTAEISAWNQTDERGFHAPDKYGKIIFSNKIIVSDIQKKN